MDRELLNIIELQKEIEELDFKGKMEFQAKESERRFITGLVKIRKNAGITQSELANSTGLTQQVVSSIEKMDRKPTLTNLIRYLLGLGIDINDLISI